MKRPELEAMLTAPPMRELDRHFALLMERLSGGERPELVLAAALVSQGHEGGNVCLDLRAVAGTQVPGENAMRAPQLKAWRTALRSAERVVGNPGEAKPLILDHDDRLYLRRYWWYQEEVATAVLRRSHGTADPLPNADPKRLRAVLDRWFPAESDATIEPDWPRVAALAAVRSRLCVISGGPGTGKTTTVVRLVGLLADLALPASLRVAIAAPTGKAAARLHDAIGAQKAALIPHLPAASLVPEEVKTIHRLLGPIPDSPYFRHDPKNPLPVDLLVVDEASMVDLALMAKLLRALPSDARVVLLGDKDQLASVEAGNLLGDLSANPEPNHFSPAFVREFRDLGGATLPVRQDPARPLADCLVQLQKSHRFGATSGIFRVSEAVNRGDAAAALAVVNATAGSRTGSISGRPLPSRRELKTALVDFVRTGYGDILRAPDAVTALRRLNQFRLLTAVREGSYGVRALNQLTEEILFEERLIGRPTEWYHGRQVLVTANDYRVGLFNGDLGVVWQDAAGTAGVWFPEPGGGARRVAPARLPAHETAFALTVHKSQGSEFTQVLLLLPERLHRVLTRELIYTGLTRARNHTELWFHEGIFREAIAHRTERASGLRDRLWPASLADHENSTS